MIQVRDLRVDYDDQCAVRDFNLEVNPGEVCGLIGPNGAGKTSTMRAILGLLEPTYGEIHVDGVDMREHPRDAVRSIGFMPDFAPMYDELKCWEFLDLFAASYKVPKPDRPAKIDEMLRLVSLSTKKFANVGELSRGMRQRLMLAKTLIPDPSVLILDEPASGVDPQGRIDLKNIIKSQAALGKAVLISSHILSEMTEFCTAIAIMQRGELVVGGRIDEIRDRVLGASILAVEVLGSQTDFRRIAESDPNCGPPEWTESGASFRYGGTAEDAADFLARLVGEGVRVSSFSRVKEGLEDLFLAVGAKELS